jgi:DNA repair protein RadD
MTIHILPGSIKCLTAYSLRPYQTEAVDKLTAAAGRSRLCVAPVGAGKTVILSELARRLVASSQRVLVLTHSGELVEQDEEALRAHMPSVDVGILQGKTRTADVSAKVLVANISSAYLAIERILEAGDVAAAIVDEAHRINPEGKVYRDTLKALREACPEFVLYGLTGSPWRDGWGNLCQRGPKDQEPIFETLAFTIEHQSLVDAGYILPVRPRATAEKLDLTGVGTNSFGDYAVGELDKRVNRDEVNARAIAELVTYGRTYNRKRWLVFATTVDHAQRLAAELRKHNVEAGCVHHELDARERRDIVEAFRVGELQAVTNVAALGTGFNVPEVDLIGLLRPTRSRVLFYQCLGRACRTSDGKVDAVVLDYGGATLRLGRIETVNWDGQVAKSKDVVWCCPSCQTYNPLTALVCDGCGERKEPVRRGPINLERSLSATDLGAGCDRMRIANVVDWSFRLFAACDTYNLKIIYRVEGYREPVTQTIWFNHRYDGWFRTMTRTWVGLGGLEPVPVTAEQALARSHELVMPAEVVAQPREYQSATYWNVTRWTLPRADLGPNACRGYEGAPA